MANIIFPIWESLENVELDEDQNADGSISTVQLLRTGTWEHPKYGRLNITPQTLDEVVKNFQADVRGVKLAVDAAHENQKEAYGWIENVRRKGDRLFADIGWTDLGKGAIKTRRYRYISAELAPKWKDDETGDEFRNVLLGAGLTNRPYIRRMVSLDESHKFSEAVLLSEDLPETEGYSGCMLLPEESKSAKRFKNGPVYKFSREDADMPNYDDGDMVTPDEAAEVLDYLVEEAENLNPEEVDNIIDSLSDEDLEELAADLEQLEEIALAGEEIYDADDDEEYDEEYDDEYDEDDEDYDDSLSTEQLGKVIAARDTLANLVDNYQNEPELVTALSEAYSLLDGAVEDANLAVMLSEGDPSTVLLAEEVMRQRERMDEQTYALHEGQVEDLVTVLLHDPETGTATITPDQADYAREILLSAPAPIRQLFCEFLNAAPPVMTFDEFGTAYSGADMDSLPAHHPDSTASQIVALAESYEERGLSRDSAMYRARQQVLGF